MNPQKIVHVLYRKLLSLYPQTFRDQLAKSMEQTFHDAYNEHKTRGSQGLFKFVSWTFTETAAGIFREHRLLIFSGDTMQTTFKNFSVSALISFLFILPFSIMEIVNRRNYNEDFPFMLFLALWINTFAFSLILLPIVLSKRANKQGNTNSNPVTGNSWLTNPKSSLIISAVLILFIVILSLLSSLGWAPMQELNTEHVSVFGIQVPSLFIAFALFSLPIIAGYVASMPIVRALQTGGSLFAYPIHLTIVVVISLFMAAGVIGMVVDQWPCFIGVEFCD